MSSLDPVITRVKQEIGDKVMVVVVNSSGKALEFQIHDYTLGEMSLQYVAVIPVEAIFKLSTMAMGDLYAFRAIDRAELAASWTTAGRTGGQQ